MKPDEIKKALECCSEHEGCHNCPCENYCGDLSVVTTEALEYINELETDNERLNKKVEELSEVLSDSIKIKAKEIKSDAIKEFAERLKGKLFYECGDVNFSETCEIRRIVDNLVAEMVGENSV